MHVHTTVSQRCHYGQGHDTDIKQWTESSEKSELTSLFWI